MRWIFYLLVVIGVLLPLWFVGKIWIEAHSLGWIWIRSETRAMYIDCCKSTASACGVAASLVALVVSVSARQPAPAGLIFIVRCAVVLLVVGLVFSIATTYGLSRAYDRAVSRWLENPNRTREHEAEQGQLTIQELRLILILAFLALVGFLEGFLFVARIAFVI